MCSEKNFFKATTSLQILTVTNHNRVKLFLKDFLIYIFSKYFFNFYRIRHAHFSHKYLRCIKIRMLIKKDINPTYCFSFSSLCTFSNEISHRKNAEKCLLVNLIICLIQNNNDWYQGCSTIIFPKCRPCPFIQILYRLFKNSLYPDFILIFEKIWIKFG